jgi:hypothetical protein
MDPIHPIAPLPPNIPPVSPAPVIGRIDRGDPRRRAGDEQRRRRQRNPLPHAVDEHEHDDGDSGSHINVTA